MQEGTIIESYRVVRRLGEGAMGSVYEAVDEARGTRVAIKVLHPQFTEDPELAARFFNEARAANMIAHPGVVKVFEVGHTSDGSAYLAMEFLEGVSLRGRLKDNNGKLGHIVLDIAVQIASALSAAHERKIVHRDLKPDNIMLLPDPSVPCGERVKILDFGIAKLLDVDDTGVKTQAGIAMGTPTYISPEAIIGAGDVTGKADVYSLGVILYQLVAGRPPFVAGGPGALLAMHLGVEPEPLAALAPDANAELVKLVHSMLRKEPAERPTMAEVVESLVKLGATLPVLDGAQAAQQTHVPAPAPPRADAAKGDIGNEPTMLAQPSEALLLPPAPAITQTEKIARRRGGRRVALAFAAALLGVLAVGGIAGWRILGGRREPARAGPVPAAVPRPAPPAPRPVQLAPPGGEEQQVRAADEEDPPPKKGKRAKGARKKRGGKQRR